MSRLENRIRFAKYPIEKCYLYHKMSEVQLKQVHYDECCFNARKCIKGMTNEFCLVNDFILTLF